MLTTNKYMVLNNNPSKVPLPLLSTRDYQTIIEASTALRRHNARYQLFYKTRISNLIRSKQFNPTQISLNQTCLKLAIDNDDVWLFLTLLDCFPSSDSFLESLLYDFTDQVFEGIEFYVETLLQKGVKQTLYEKTAQTPLGKALAIQAELAVDNESEYASQHLDSGEIVNRQLDNRKKNKVNHNLIKLFINYHHALSTEPHLSEIIATIKENYTPHLLIDCVFREPHCKLLAEAVSSDDHIDIYTHQIQISSFDLLQRIALILQDDDPLEFKKLLNEITDFDTRRHIVKITIKHGKANIIHTLTELNLNDLEKMAGDIKYILLSSGRLELLKFLDQQHLLEFNNIDLLIATSSCHQDLVEWLLKEKQINRYQFRLSQIGSLANGNKATAIIKLLLQNSHPDSSFGWQIDIANWRQKYCYLNYWFAYQYHFFLEHKQYEDAINFVMNNVYRAPFLELVYGTQFHAITAEHILTTANNNDNNDSYTKFIAAYQNMLSAEEKCTYLLPIYLRLNQIEEIVNVCESIINNVRPEVCEDFFPPSVSAIDIARFNLALLLRQGKIVKSTQGKLILSHSEKNDLTMPQALQIFDDVRRNLFPEAISLKLECLAFFAGTTDEAHPLQNSPWPIENFKAFQEYFKHTIDDEIWQLFQTQLNYWLPMLSRAQQQNASAPSSNTNLQQSPQSSALFKQTFSEKTLTASTEKRPADDLTNPPSTPRFKENWQNKSDFFDEVDLSDISIREDVLLNDDFYSNDASSSEGTTILLFNKLQVFSFEDFILQRNSIPLLDRYHFSQAILFFELQFKDYFVNGQFKQVIQLCHNTVLKSAILKATRIFNHCLFKLCNYAIISSYSFYQDNPEFLEFLDFYLAIQTTTDEKAKYLLPLLIELNHISEVIQVCSEITNDPLAKVESHNIVRFELGNLFFVGRITLDNNGNYIVAEIQTLDPSTEVLLQRVIHSLPFLANNPLPEAKALMKQGLVILKGKSNIETGNIENTVERWPFSNAEKVYGHHKNTSNPEIRKLIQEQAQFLIEEAMRLKEEVNYKMVRNKKFY